MYNFKYVTKAEQELAREELINMINIVQYKVKNYFTFQYSFIGSSSRNMVTQDFKSNIGFDFDVNLEINHMYDYYEAKEIHNILKRAFDEVVKEYGYSYCEESTRVLTIKVKDSKKSKIVNSCDIAIIKDFCGVKKYIRYNKNNENYTWEYVGKGFLYLEEKMDSIKNKGLWNKLRGYYLYKKNFNNDSNKHSRSIFAEAVNDIYHANDLD